MNYKDKCKLLIGERIKDLFCNGFFGRDAYCCDGNVITRLLEVDSYIVLEVRNEDTMYEYAYFDKDYYDWNKVYQYLSEWINYNSMEEY